MIFSCRLRENMHCGAFYPVCAESATSGRASRAINGWLVGSGHHAISMDSACKKKAVVGSYRRGDGTSIKQAYAVSIVGIAKSLVHCDGSEPPHCPTPDFRSWLQIACAVSLRADLPAPTLCSDQPRQSLRPEHSRRPAQARAWGQP